MKHFLAILSILGMLAAPTLEASTVPLGQVVYNSVAIANAGTTSSAITTNGMSLVGLLFPATLTSTTVTFTVSGTLGGTYVALKNSSGAVSYTIAQGTYMSITPSDFAGVQFFKIVMGSSEGGARTIIASLKGI